MRTDILINDIVKETAKAICVTLTVNWAEGKLCKRDFWFPKSLAKVVNANGHDWLSVENWFVDKLRCEKQFNGYRMNFVEC